MKSYFQPWMILLMILLSTPLAISSSAGQGTFSRAKTLCKVQHDKLDEISGIVHSRRTKGLFWVHNDSGDGPYIYGLDTNGKLVAGLALTNGRAYDWEDIATGYYKKKRCLFVGDIGDNYRRRSTIQVYIVKEPTTSELKQKPFQKVQALKTLTISYPDGAHNAEGMAVDRAGNLIIWEKHTTRYPSLYIAYSKDLESKSKITMKKLATIDLVKFIGRKSKRGYQITGADVSPDGRWMAIRGYTWACEFAWNYKSFKPKSGLKVRVPRAPQAEAIGYMTSNVLITTSEKKNQPIYTLSRNRP